MSPLTSTLLTSLQHGSLNAVWNAAHDRRHRLHIYIEAPLHLLTVFISFGLYMRITAHAFIHIEYGPGKNDVRALVYTQTTKLCQIAGVLLLVWDNDSHFQFHFCCRSVATLPIAA